jgi:hypothetical protein
MQTDQVFLPRIAGVVRGRQHWIRTAAFDRLSQRATMQADRSPELSQRTRRGEDRATLSVVVTGSILIAAGRAALTSSPTAEPSLRNSMMARRPHATRPPPRPPRRQLGRLLRPFFPVPTRLVLLAAFSASISFQKTSCGMPRPSRNRFRAASRIDCSLGE